MNFRSVTSAKSTCPHPGEQEEKPEKEGGDGKKKKKKKRSGKVANARKYVNVFKPFYFRV